MSLIFEALKKLEREKQAPDRGLVVVGPAALHHPPERGSGRTWLAAAAGAALALLAVVAILVLRGPAAPAAGVVSTQATQPVAPAGIQPVPALVPATAAPAPRSAAGPAAARLTPSPEPLRPRPESGSSAEVASPPAAASTPAPVVAPPTALPPAATAPAAAAPAPRTAVLTLHAISQRDGQPVAIINERLVREGDSFDGVRVLKIGAAEVEIEVRGERQVLRF